MCEKAMAIPKAYCCVLWLYFIMVACLVFQCCAAANQTSTLVVDASNASRRPMPDTLFGIFFEVGKDYGANNSTGSSSHL